MSKAVTNEEVEDVLSSIRRLVSEDKRPLAGLRSAPVAAPEDAAEEPDLPEAHDPDGGEAADEAAVPAEDATSQDDAADTLGAMAAEHFVLTPALRVLTPDPEAEQTDHGDQEGSAADTDDADEGPLDLGSVARETWTADADETSDEAEESASAPMILFPASEPPEKDAAMEALDALVHDAIESEAKALEDAIDEGDYADEGFWEDAEDDSAQEDLTDAQAVSSDPERHDEYDGQWDLREDEGHVDDVTVEDAHEHSDDDSTAQTGPEADEAPFFEDEDEAGRSENLDEARSPYIPLTAKIAALEAVIGGKAQEFEPEADDLAVSDTPAMAWEDDVELDAKGEPFVSPAHEVEDAAPAPEFTRSEAEEGQDSEPAAAFAADDQVMDEEALRDLVGEIVRAELQGALGERITRNVRKLVRREIHRALIAQEME